MTPQRLADALETLADGPPWDTAWLQSLLPELAVRGRLVRQEEEWDEQPLASIVDELRPGFACSKSHQKAGGIVHLRTHNVGSAGEFNQDLLVTIDPAQVDPKKRGIRKDDVIFNNTNSRELVGKSCLVPSDLDYAYSNHMTLLRPGPRLTGTFLWCCLQVYWRSGFFQKTCKAWIGQAGVDTRAVGALQIPIPPLAEQHRVVAKVDELMGHAAVLEERHLAASSTRVRLRDAALHALAEAEDHEAVETAWQRIEEHFEDLFTEPEDIQPLRQTILQLAVRGRLVSQEEGDGDARAVLEQVGLERQAAISSGKVRKTKPARPVDVVELGCPHRWAPTSLEDVVDPLRPVSYGVLKPGPEVEGGVPLVKSQNVLRGSVSLDGLQRISASLDSEFSRTRLFGGEVLVNVVGSLGRAAVAPAELQGANVSRAVAVVAVSKAIFAGFLEVFLNAILDERRAHELGTGSAQPVLNLSTLRGVRMHLPPLAEQHRIVAKVDELMALCDTLEASLTRAKAAREQFAASISAAIDDTPTPN